MTKSCEIVRDRSMFFFIIIFFFVGEIDIDGAMTKHINCDLNANGPL